MIGVEPTTFLYDAATPARDIALPVPEAALASGTLHVTFRFPDAVSPRAAGLSADPRQLAIAFKTVSFDVETQTPAH